MIEGHEQEISKLIEFVELVRDCPPEAVHLMPLAAQALLAGNNQSIKERGFVNLGESLQKKEKANLESE